MAISLTERVACKRTQSICVFVATKTWRVWLVHVVPVLPESLPGLNLLVFTFTGYLWYVYISRLG